MVIETEPQEKVIPEPETVALKGPKMITTEESAMKVPEAAEEMLLEEVENLEPKETIFSEIPEIAVVEETQLESGKKLTRDKPQEEEEEELSPPKRPRLSSIGEVRASSGRSVSLLGPEFETFIGEESYVEESIRNDLYNSLIQAISKTTVTTFSSITESNSRLEVSKDVKNINAS